MDILDLSDFNGSWQAALGSMIEDPSLRKKILELFRAGTPVVHPNASGYSVLSSHRMEFKWRPHARLLLRAAVVMPVDARSRLVDFIGTGQQSGVPMYPWISIASSNEDRAGTGGRITAADLRHVEQHWGMAPTDFIAMLTDLDPQTLYTHRVLQTFPDLDQVVTDEIERVRATLTPSKNQHSIVWERLEGVPTATMHLLVAELADGATANSNTVRAMSRKRLSTFTSPELHPALEQLAREARPPQRARAVAYLAELHGQAGRAGLLEWISSELAAEKSEVVLDEIAKLADRTSLDDPSRPQLPSVHIPEVRNGIFVNVPQHGRADGSMLERAMRGDPAAHNRMLGWMLSIALKDQPELAVELHPGHVARVILRSPTWGREAELLRAVGAFSPLELTAVAVMDGVAPIEAVRCTTSLLHDDPTLWTADELTEWVAYHSHDLEILLETKTDDYTWHREGVLRAIEMSTSRSRHLDDALVLAAISGYKNDRPHLMRIVDESFADSVIPYLASKKRAERIGAAAWLRERPMGAAADPLRAAARREKDDQAKAALLVALEALGEPLDEFLGAESLLADAAKALAKKNAIPKAMEWLDIDALPALTWADGTPVDRSIVTWFCASAVKSKTAEPSPIMRRHFANMNEAQARNFGRVVFDLWLNEDLRTLSDEEAVTQAKAAAPSRQRYSRRHQNMALADVEAEIIIEKRSEIAGSATASKGLLAVAAASAGPALADRVLAYVRKHRGQRLGQGKALIQMLAWIDQPATTQVVMSIATRFRPKSLQQTAEEQAGLLAERHGWTVDDLADRSVPDGGFETNGRQVIDYGTRTFTAHLGDDLTISLTNDETGKSMRSLPQGRADEDADLIKNLKKDLGAAKKEIKSAATLQPDRLHQAMSIQRAWSGADFRRYFMDHPVMSRLATRLVWTAATATATASASSFRPLTDGTLVDAADEDVDLSDDMEVTLAHECLLDPSKTMAWQQHLVDYEVASLFPQFGRPAPELAEGQSSITDFEGHMIQPRSLQVQASRQGWQNGPGQDSGYVHAIVKPIPTLGLKAVIDVHGGMVPGYYGEQEPIVAIGPLYLVGIEEYESAQSARMLDGAPSVLLSELFADLQAMANAGTGFDPDFMKRAGTV